MFRNPPHIDVPDDSEIVVFVEAGLCKTGLAQGRDRFRKPIVGGARFVSVRDGEGLMPFGRSRFYVILSANGNVMADVVISHASEDKETVVRPLADALKARNWESDRRARLDLPAWQSQTVSELNLQSAPRPPRVRWESATSRYPFLSLRGD